jgi:PAS domain S-box-containing protein
MEKPSSPQPTYEELAAEVAVLRAQAAIRQQVNAIMRNLADGVTAQDRRGRLVFANDTAARLVGVPSVQALLEAPPGSLVDRYEILDQHGRPVSADELPGRRVLRGESGDEVLLHFHDRGGGEERWATVQANPIYDANGRVQFALTIFRDVTERRRAAETREALAAIVEGSADAIIAKTLDGIITSWNAGAERLYGYTAAEVVGKSVSLLIPPEHPSELLQILARLARGERVENYDTVRQRKDGTLLHVSLTISPIRDATGAVVGASAIGRDITTRRRLEEEREQALREAEAAIALREQFLSIAAHELRTPLTPLRGSLQLLGRQLVRGAPLDAIQASIRRTIQQVDRLTRLFNSTLDVSRIAEGRLTLERAPTALLPLLERVVEMQREAIEPPPHIALVPPVYDALVLADADRLEQVLVNLLDNAAKYSPHGAPIVVCVKEAKSAVTVEVRDEGIGIPTAERERIFERFHRAANIDPGVSGLGLGLYISREIARAHGGELTVESGPGGGSTFRLSLPRLREAEAQR